MIHHYALLAAGPDRVGLQNSIASWLRGSNAVAGTNFRIFSDSGGTVFVRAEFTAPTSSRERLRAAFQTVATQWELATWRIQVVAKPLIPDAAKPRLLVLVTKADHCLAELLSLHSKGILPATITAVAGNHLDLQDMTERAGIPFVHIPWPSITSDPAGNAAAHDQLLRLAKANAVDLVVLARFMQILRPEVLDDLEAINIHHSLLPSFVGARPYHQAHARGVKVIGATAHYVTAKLDQGPILAQRIVDVERLGRRPTAAQLAEAGRAAETEALLAALTGHCLGEVIAYDGGTVHIEP
ncbi:MAG: formyltetrahydrofolate deformylase [Pseudonocardiales bacterium]|jgi:formyltetrahydrofolate deformylase|nr:formyltetrahydrofolate deformylase [Pseudonocardiales bacterium]